MDMKEHMRRWLGKELSGLNFEMVVYKANRMYPVGILIYESCA